MNSLLDNDTEDDLDDRPVRARDREITLGTTMVLGIFFALAAYGAVLFGFGYSLGVKHTSSSTTTTDSSSGTNFGGFKPAPGSPLSGAGIKPLNGPMVTVPDSSAAMVMPVPAPRPAPAPRVEAPVDTAASSTPVAAPIPAPRVQTVSSPTPAPASVASPALVQPSATGAFLVQVAAVSHQEDADLLVVTLKRRGYPVVIHHEPQDSLLHVQIGNFANKKDAEAMRQRLLADGFNAIVK